MKKRGKKISLWLIVILVSAGVLLCLLFFSFFFSENLFGNVAYIPIKGTITVDSSSSIFGAESASSEKIVGFIEDADQDPMIEVILLDINSPGGSAVASDEIAQAIKRTNKTTLAVIHEVGASGGYWIASSADYIVANRMSIVGSIGVISSYLEFSRLLNDYNITYQRLVAGQYKDMGTPYKELTEEERTLLQSKINKIHDFFIDEIAANRNLPREKVQEISTGEIFLGSEAQQLGLVDLLGDQKTAEEFMKKELGLKRVDYVYYKTKTSFWSSLTQAFSPFFYYMGIGMGQTLFDTTKNLGIRV